MAKVRIKGLPELFDKIKRTIKIDEKLAKDIGEFASDRIVAKARTGKTMFFGLGERPIKDLKPSTIKRREALVKDEKKRLKGKTGQTKKMAQYYHRQETGSKVDPEFFSPKKSNLTLSGQFLKSIKLLKNESDLQNGRVVVGAEGKRQPFGKEKKVPSNEELAKYLSEGGRPIFGLDKVARERIKKMVIEYLRRKLAQNRLRKK